MNNELNTEIEQAKFEVNLPQIQEFQKPSFTPWSLFSVRRILLVAIILIATVFIFCGWYFFTKTSSLSDSLSSDTQFYFSLNLPKNNYWFEQVFNWQRSERPNQKLNRVYQKIDLISWSQVGFQEKLLPLFIGKLELARTADGSLVFKTTLRDQAKWLGLFGLTSENYTGQTITADLSLSGSWVLLTKNPNKINWQIIGNDLYLSDNAEILSKIKDFKGESLEKIISKLNIKKSLAIAYIKDKNFISNNNLISQDLLQDISFPIVLTVDQSNQAINFIVYNQNQVKNKSNDQNSIQWRVLGSDKGIYWQPDGKKDLLKDISSILLGFYNIDTNLLLTENGTRENLLTFFGEDWLYNIADQDLEPNQELLKLLSDFGRSLFANSHPQAVERILVDGSKMIELRAETNDLTWQSLDWAYADVKITLNVLVGQGEDKGYYFGFVPKVGYILSTSLSAIDKYLALEKNKISIDFKTTGCSLSQSTAILGYLPINLLAKDSFLSEIGEKFIISLGQDGKIAGCLMTVD